MKDQAEGIAASPATDPIDDFHLSPYTGWTRDHWVGLAHRLLGSAQRYGSDNHARIHIPGAVGAYGHDVDGLEGFARTFLAAGFLAAGSEGRDLASLDWYAEGFRYGPDPTLDPALRWVRPSEHDQAKVEACSLALILHLTRPYLWDQLDARTQEMTVDYLAEWIHASYPKNNWVWFRLITGQFLKSVGGSWSTEDQAEDLAFNESCYVDGGWYRDGLGRTFDYYGGWVFQVYPLLWCDMMPDDPESVRLRPVFQQRLDAYLADIVHLIGSDGAMLVQGRSLIYRFAAAATLWMGAVSGSTAISPGLIRRAASGVVKHFATHGVPDDQGLLSMGWYGPWRKLAQAYSGPSSPYWACKSLLGLALPAAHPVWTATEEGLPSDAADGVRALPVPGWIVSSTRTDGIVRIANHGTDHAESGSDRADSPLYANIGYSTATFPLLDDAAWVTPLAQSVCLLDQTGRASHRTGFTPLGVSAEPDHRRTVIAASQAEAHWVDPAPTQFRHGSGYTGQATPAGVMTVLSLLRGPWEVRAIRLNSIRPEARCLRVGGWVMTGNEITSTTSSDAADGYASVSASGLVSSVQAISNPAAGGIRFQDDASPLGTPSAVPYLDFPVQTGRWITILVTLSAQVSPEPGSKLGSGDNARVTADIRSAGNQLQARVIWPDGVDTESQLDLSATLGGAVSYPTITTVPPGTPCKGDI